MLDAKLHNSRGILRAKLVEGLYGVLPGGIFIAGCNSAEVPREAIPARSLHLAVQHRNRRIRVKTSGQVGSGQADLFWNTIYRILTLVTLSL